MLKGNCCKRIRKGDFFEFNNNLDKQYDLLYFDIDNDGDKLLEMYEKNIENIQWEKYDCKLYKHWSGYKLSFIDGKNAIENDKKQDVEDQKRFELTQAKLETIINNQTFRDFEVILSDHSTDDTIFDLFNGLQ